MSTYNDRQLSVASYTSYIAHICITLKICLLFSFHSIHDLLLSCCCCCWI